MFNFLKNAIFRGLVVLIPVVILYVTAIDGCTGNTDRGSFSGGNL